MTRILITGASKGIGYVTAVHLAKAGHELIAAMRNPAACDIAEVARREGLNIRVAMLDVDSDASVAALFAREAEGLDVLVNNAGIANIQAIEDEPIERFAAVMNTNYLGAVRCAKAVLPAMRKRRAGLIINVTSIAGRMPPVGEAAYSASKFALEAFSECLAQEAGAFGVRVAVVEPGIISTPMTVDLIPPKADSAYPHAERMLTFFRDAASGPPPTVVAQTIADIVSGKSTRFRNPSGPDAEGLLGWRAGYSDEDWIALGAILDNAEYFQRVFEVTGLDLRAPKAAAE